MNLPKFWFLPLLGVLFAGASLAQAPVSLRSPLPVKEDDLRMLKMEMSTLMVEKQFLEKDHFQLQQEYADVKKGFAQIMRDILEMNPDILADEKMRESHQQWIEQLGKDLEGFEDEHLIQKFRNAYMARDLIDESQMQTLRRLYLADLYYLKRDLELQLKWAQYEQQQKLLGLKEEINKLKKKYQTNLERERALSIALQAKNNGEPASDLDKSDLQQENRILQKDSRRLKEQLKREQEAKALREKKTQTGLDPLFKEIQDKEARREELRRALVDLEDQRAGLTQILQQSLSRTQVLRALTEQMVILDRENQLLRKRISEFQGRTSFLRK